jgi:hypothetical protein
VIFANAYWLSWPARTFDRQGYQVQMRGWAELGRWIAAYTPADVVIATDAAGLIPYHSGRKAIDMFGLTDRHIAHRQVPNLGEGVVGHEKTDPEYILSRRPDCIVSTWMDADGQAVSANLAAVKDRFESVYRLVAVAKINQGPPQDGRWVLEIGDYTPTLHQAGYISGLFCRR